MKTLTQQITESLNTKTTKDVDNEKTVDEDSASFMRANPSKDSVLTRGTTRVGTEEKNN
jgi:hypothetical protein